MRKLGGVLLHAATILMATACAAGSPPGSGEGSDSGIRGQVVVSPASPGPVRPGQATEAPLRASFSVYQDEQKVARFQTDDDGRFELALQAGDYTIVPDEGTPVPYATRQETDVTVPEGRYADVTVRLDSGMR